MQLIFFSYLEHFPSILHFFLFFLLFYFPLVLSQTGTKNTIGSKNGTQTNAGRLIKLRWTWHKIFGNGQRVNVRERVLSCCGRQSRRVCLKIIEELVAALVECKCSFIYTRLMNFRFSRSKFPRHNRPENFPGFLHVEMASTNLSVILNERSRNLESHKRVRDLLNNNWFKLRVFCILDERIINLNYTCVC